MRNVGKGVEKREPLCTICGNVIDVATMENSMESPQKIENRIVIWSSSSTTGYLSRENKNTNLKRSMNSSVHCSIIYNSQDMDAT